MHDTNIYTRLHLGTKRLVKNIFSGNHRAAFLGKGIEFEGYKNYDYDSDADTIDMLASQREGNIISRVYREERQLDIYVLSDLHTPANDKKKNFMQHCQQDILSNIIFLIGNSSLISGDRFGFGDLENNYFIPPKTGNIQLQILLQYLEDRGSFQNKLSVGTNAITNSLIFYVTSGEKISKKLLQLCSQNDVIVVHVSHSFQNNLQGNGVFSFTSGASCIAIDLDNTEKKKKYISLRRKKIKAFEKKVYDIGARYTHIDETQNIYACLNTILHLK